LLNFGFLVSVAVLFDDLLDANFLNFQKFDDFSWGVGCEGVASEVFFELELGVGNVGHFLSLDFFSVFDDFVNLEEVFLGVRTDLGTSPEGN
jgi:hypothetical protein